MIKFIKNNLEMLSLVKNINFGNSIKNYLSEEIKDFDKRLLKNFYLNKGYYNVEINSSFAKLLKENNFELIFNIKPNKKVYFNNLKINLPKDFNIQNFSEISELFDEYKGSPYSINKVEKILEKIEIITINEQNLSVNASIEEEINDDKLDITFIINETDKYFVEKLIYLETT